MTARLIFSLSLLIAAAPCRALTSFDGTELQFSSPRIAATAPAPAPRSASAPSTADSSLLPLPQKEYTVMLFMNGKNNLGPMMVRKLIELQGLGSDENVNFVMELGILSSTVPATYNPGWGGVRRYYVTRPAESGTAITSVRLSDPPDPDMGNYRSLVAFANWAKTNFPAKKYILVVGNHGGAWVDKQKKPHESSAKGVSYDDLTGNYITTPEIGTALREIGGADILIFDDCLMQTAEVAAEVGTAARFIAGSEEISYTNHFKPFLFFSPLKLQPTISPEAFMASYNRLVATHMAKLWADYGKFPGTASTLDTSKLAGFQALVRQYAAAARRLMAESPAAKDAYRVAMRGVTRYHYKYCVDLYHFLSLSQEAIAATPAATTEKARETDQLAAQLKAYISDQLVPYNFTVGNAGGVDYSFSRGISIYIPIIRDGATAEAQPTFLIAPGTLQTRYTDLAFDKDTSWSLFVKDLIAKPKP